MQMLMDNSSTRIWKMRSEHKLPFGQLRTPLTQYRRDALDSIHYGLDNGAFTDFRPATFRKMAEAAKNDPLCDWIVIPDVVGDHEAPLAQYETWWKILGLGLFGKRAFVAQDGCLIPPWDDLECLFIGGSRSWKNSRVAYELAVEAKERKKHVHIGGINTAARVIYWAAVADTFDGSALVRYEHMMTDVITALHMLQDSEATTLEDFA